MCLRSSLHQQTSNNEYAKDPGRLAIKTPQLLGLGLNYINSNLSWSKQAKILSNGLAVEYILKCAFALKGTLI